MKERIRKHGEIVVRFVNAKTVDEAVLQHFSNMNDFLGFGPSFLDEVKAFYPSVWHYDSLEERLHELDELMDQSDDFPLERIKAKIETFMTDFPEWKVTNPEWNLRFSKTLRVGQCYDYIRTVGFRMSEISAFGHIQWLYKRLLDEIVEGKTLDKTDLRFTLDRYNELSKARYILEGNDFRPIFHVNEGDYFIVDDCDGPIVKPGEFNEERFSKYHYLYSRIDDDLTYSLIEFLRSDGRKYLKKCQHRSRDCKTYFIAQKIDKRIKYCSVCSPKSKLSKEEKKEAVRKHRAKKRNFRIVQEKEEFTKRQRDAGWSEEETEENWELYRVENNL